MAETALNGGKVEPPLAIDRVDRARGQGDQVRLRLTGRWLTARDVADLDALLIVQMNGRRHRFPASRQPDEAGSDRDAWTASFTVPDWAVPDQPGQASLWVGTAIVAVPPPGTSAEEGASPAPTPPAAPAVSTAEEVALPGPIAVAPDVPLETGRSGPLADALFKETVAALHAELEQRATEVARLRAGLADARAELDSRGRRQSELELAHGELRHELGELMEAVGRQRSEFDERLSAALAGAEEVERTREQVIAERDEARAELARAREDVQQARAQADGARAELERLRTELDAQLAHVQQQTEARLVDARAELDEHLQTARVAFEREAAAIRAEGDAEAGRLDERLVQATAAERHRAQEVGVLREHLAAAQISRDAALAEAQALRVELERLGTELSVTRERGAGAGADLGEAQQLLADARALTEQLRAASAG